MKYLKICFYILLANVLPNVSYKHSMETVYRRQVQLLVEMIKTVNSLHTFDNIIFYRTPDEVYEVPVNKNGMLTNSSWSEKSVGDMLAEYMISSRLVKPVMTFSIEPWDYVNDTDSIPNLGRILTNKNLAVVILNDIFNTDVKEFVSTSLGASLDTKLIFLLIGHELTNVLSFVRLEKLKRFFRWCWSKNMLNVILLFQKDHIVNDISELSLEVYTYTPFPKPTTLIQLTKEDPSNYYVDRTLDLMGYEFKTPVFNDKPSVFKATHARLGTEHVTGISGHLYVEFVKKINGTFVELEGEPRGPMMVDYENELLVARNIDIGIHAFSYILPNNYYGSYPITNTNSCVLVPVVPEIFPGLYIPLTLNLNMWVLLLLMFLVFQIVYLLLDMYSYGKWRPWDNIATTIRGMLNMPLGNIHQIKCKPGHKPPSPLATKRKLSIHMLLILSGMLFTQIHIAALASLLSATIYGKQLDTIEDLRKANISIMLQDYMFFTYNYLDLIPLEFEPHVLIADVDTVSKHLNSFNTSYAYIVYNEEWKVVQNLQENLWKPRFRVAQKLCIPNIYLSLPMQFNSPFYHPLKNFILRIQETGLEMKWTDDILRDIRQTTSGKISQMESLERPVRLTLAHFTAMWCVLVVGLGLASLTFLWELQMRKKAAAGNPLKSSKFK